jgi:hypothetical protein
MAFGCSKVIDTVVFIAVLGVVMVFALAFLFA